MKDTGDYQKTGHNTIVKFNDDDDEDDNWWSLLWGDVNFTVEDNAAKDKNG